MLSEVEASQNWIFNQNQFFLNDNKIHFVKTHSTLDEYKGRTFHCIWDADTSHW